MTYDRHHVCGEVNHSFHLRFRMKLRTIATLAIILLPVIALLSGAQ